MTWANVLPYILATIVVGMAARYGPRILSGDRKKTEADASAVGNASAITNLQTSLNETRKDLDRNREETASLRIETIAAHNQAERCERRADWAEDCITILKAALIQARVSVPALPTPPTEPS